MQDSSPGISKKSVTLSIDDDLLVDAAAAGTDLSRLLERALRTELKAQREARWVEENSAAIEWMNDYVKENGLPLAKHRPW